MLKTPPASAVLPDSLPLDDRICWALEEMPNGQGRILRIESHDGHVTLHGTVRSYYHKQIAQELVRRVAGVSTIENRLEVLW
jgi:osmotically-inducible protein OsmY